MSNRGTELRRHAVLLARHASVAAVSAAILVAAVSYVLSPTAGTLAAGVAVRAAAVGAESIGGRILEDGHGATGASVTLFRRARGRTFRLHARLVDRQGGFAFHEPPGLYIVILRHGSARLRIVARLGRGRTVSITAVVKRAGGFAVAPVIFGY